MKYIFISLVVSLGLTACSPKLEKELTKPTLTKAQACAFLQNEASVAKEEIWQKRAQCDLLAGHEVTLASHPGPVDPLNPEFMKTANGALENALALTEKAKTSSGYQSVMDAYTAKFKDGHFQLATTKKLWVLPTGTGGLKWAGILIGWRDGRFTAVYTEDTSGVKQGDQLISCDGIRATDLMKQNVFAFSHYRDDDPSSWVMLSRHLLADNGNPLISVPQNCVFNGSDGKYNVPLHWHERPDDYWDIAPKAMFGEVPKTGIKEIKPGIWWVNAADFSPDNDTKRQAVKDVIAQIKAKQGELRRAKAIVFDTRGNNGGSSLWGKNILKALYGEDYFKYRNYLPDQKVEYRLSQENLDHMSFIREEYGVKQNNQEIIDWVDEKYDGMKAGLAKGNSFYSVPDDEIEAAPVKVNNPVNAKVYLFTHGWCGSACLDFADYVYAMEGSNHIGYYTSSDSPYMEVRSVTLPTGFGRAIVPIKVYRNRPRGDGEYYTPGKIFNGYDWTDEGVQNWFLNEVFKE